MMRATGGLAIGATSTRSNPCSIAAASAVSTSIMPSCAPSAAITLIGLMRICLLTRTRLVVSWIRSSLMLENKNADPIWSPRGDTSPTEDVVSWHELLQHASGERGPKGGTIRPDRPLIALGGRKLDPLGYICKR